MIRHTLWLGWWLLIVGLILAVLLSLIRLSFPLLGQYKAPLLATLSEQSGYQISVARFETGWRGPFPIFEFSDIEVRDPASPEQNLLQLDQLKFELNPWRSLLDWAPIFQRVDSAGLSVRLEQRDGRWFRPVKAQVQTGLTLTPLMRSLVGVLLVQPALEIRDSQLELVPEIGITRRINLRSLLFENSEDQHQLSGQFWMPLLGEDTRLEFVIQPEMDRDSRLRLPFYLRLENLGPELFQLADITTPLRTLEGQAEIWGTLSDRQLEDLRGHIELVQAEFALHGQSLKLLDSTTDLMVLPLDAGYQIQLRNGELADGSARLSLPAIAIDLHQRADGLSLGRLMFDRLPLEPSWQWLRNQPLSEALLTTLDQLSPQGDLAHGVIDFNDALAGPVLRADLVDVGVKPWHGAPGVTAANGLLTLSASGGRVDLRSDNLALDFDQIYQAPLQFSGAGGQIRWSLTDAQLNLSSGNLWLSHPLYRAQGRFSLQLPFASEQQSYLELMIGLQQADASAAALLTPRQVVGEGLHDWLSGAITAGEVPLAALVVRTPTRSLEDRPRPSVELFVATENTELNYQPPWPALQHLQGSVHYRDGDLRVETGPARLLDTTLSSSLTLRPRGQDQIEVVAAVDGWLDRMNRLFRDEPLASSVGATLADWQLGGQHQSLIHLNLPLQGGEPRVRVKAEVQGGVFASELHRMALTDINGTLTFDNRNGLNAKGLRAQFLASPIQADISTQGALTEIAINGKMDSGRLMHWASIPLQNILSGEIPLRATMKLCAQQQCQNSLQIESNLNKTRVDAPAYLAKSSDSASRLSLLVDMGYPAGLKLNYADRLRGNLLLGEKFRGTLTLGGEPARLTDAPGLLLNGRMPELEVNELLTLLGRLENNTREGGEAAPLLADLQVDRLSIGDLYLDEVSATLDKQGDQAQLTLFGRDADGSISWQRDPRVALHQQRYQVALNRLHINAPSFATGPGEAEPVVVLTDPAILAQIPAFDIDIASLAWNNAELGRWRTQLRSNGVDAVRLNDLSGTLQAAQISGEAEWSLQPNEISKVVLDFRGDDFGDLLEQLGESRIIETETFSGSLSLVWPAAPWQFNKRTMDGGLKFTAGSGRVIESGSGTGLLRLFGILNFNNLIRRLKLDFSDLFLKGIAFDELSGDYLIQRGIATAVSPLKMKGPSADMEARGDIDLVQRTLKQEISLTLPLVSNTPLAALLLGAPQVAGALFIIDKLIGDKLEQATALNYSLSGSWESPDLNVKEAVKQ